MKTTLLCLPFSQSVTILLQFTKYCILKVCVTVLFGIFSSYEQSFIGCIMYFVSEKKIRQIIYFLNVLVLLQAFKSDENICQVPNTGSFNIRNQKQITQPSVLTLITKTKNHARNSVMKGISYPVLCSWVTKLLFPTLSMN